MKLKDIFKKHEDNPDNAHKKTECSDAVCTGCSGKTEKSETINLDVDENDQVVATAEGQEINQSVIENPVSEPDSIQTIPLNDEDIANLINNGYEQAKKICKTSYLIEKAFIGYVESQDPTNPGRRPVKVKRVAELKAASLMHALSMIGWDNNNVTVISTKTDPQSKLDVKANGKLIGSIDISNRPVYSRLSGGQKNHENNQLVKMILEDDGLKINFDPSKVEIAKVIHVPNHYINVVTKKIKQHACCGCCSHN